MHNGYNYDNSQFYKESLNSDEQQIDQYQQHESLPLIYNLLTQNTTRYPYGYTALVKNIHSVNDK